MMKLTEETKLGVLSTLDKIAEAFEERDLDKMMSLFSTDEDMIVMGTGADEKRVGKSEAIEATVYARIGSREIHLPSRLTIIMKKSGKQWLIVHWHASLPASGQQTGEAWPMNIPVV
jgi:hypothetical protein